MNLKCLLLSSLVFASSVTYANTDLRKEVESALMETLGSEAVVTSADLMAGGEVIEVQMMDGSILHMLPGKKHIIFRGSIYSLNKDGLKNASMEKMNPIRKKAMAAIQDSDTITFPATGEEKTKISIFTDIDCVFCQKIHKEVPELNKMGITVRYLSYPRSGIIDPQTKDNTESFKKLAYAWCQPTADDKRQTLTRMKSLQQELGVIARGENPAAHPRFNTVVKSMTEVLQKDISDCTPPVEMEYNLGRRLGVQGTPAIITESGEMLPGYLPAAELAKKIGVN